MVTKKKPVLSRFKCLFYLWCKLKW